MLNDLRSYVTEFHRIYGVPIKDKPIVPTTDRIALRLNLITEEFLELLEASGFGPEDPSAWRNAKDTWKAYVDLVNRDDVDIVGVADACADLMYVIMGLCLEFGINIEAVLDEVHRSNRSKLGADGKPVYREDGKVIKGPNYVPPDIASVL